MKKITVVSGCYNEEDNLAELLRQVWAMAARISGYEWSCFFLDRHLHHSPMISFAGRCDRLKDALAFAA